MNQLSDFCEIMDPQGVMRLRRYECASISYIRARIRARPNSTPRRRNYVSPISRFYYDTRCPFRSVLRGFLVFLWPALSIRIDAMRSGGARPCACEYARDCVRSRTNGASGPFDSSDRKDRKSFDRLVIQNARPKGATD